MLATKIAKSSGNVSESCYDISIQIHMYLVVSTCVCNVLFCIYHRTDKGLLDASVCTGDDIFKQQKEKEVVDVGKMECEACSPPLTTQVNICNMYLYMYIHVYVRTSTEVFSIGFRCLQPARSTQIAVRLTMKNFMKM